MPSSDPEIAPTLLVFDLPWVLVPGFMLVAISLAIALRGLLRNELRFSEVAALILLRGIALSLGVVLVAKPVSVQKEPPRQNPYVAVLVDRSQSMSLSEGGTPRFNQATGYLFDKMAPALAISGFHVHPWLFAESAAPASSSDLQSGIPNGKATDIANALIQSVITEKEPPWRWFF